MALATVSTKGKKELGSVIFLDLGKILVSFQKKKRLGEKKKVE